MKRTLIILVVAMLALTGFAAAQSEPTTVQFWHTRGSGANYDALLASVDAFNATVGKEKNIFVEETFIGGYNEILTKTQLAIQAGEQPDIVVIGNTMVGNLIDDGLLVDLLPYAQKSGFDVNNLMTPFQKIYGNADGTLYSLPYIRSTPMFYYNKTMSDAKGLTPPTTIEEVVEFCKALYEKDAETGEVKVYGFEILNDFGYYHAAFLQQLGSGMFTPDGKSSPALEDGTMLRILTDWRTWVDEGWCLPFASTSAGSQMKEMFYQGKLGAYLDSSGGLRNTIKAMDEAGLELGVMPFPTYDVNKPLAEIGGGQIVAIAAGNSEEEIAAAWEYLQFIMTDEQVANNSIGSGYLPVTKSVGTYSKMTEFWAENPHYKVAYDQLETAVCQENPYVTFLQDYTQACWDAVSLLIQDQSITPEEAVEQIRTTTEHMFQ
ncbi:MAG: ABC transporter substrate-binding protein [Christensenellales bacterium]